MHVRHSQLQQVVDTRFLAGSHTGTPLCKRQILSLMRHARYRVHREVPIVHLVDNGICLTLKIRTAVLIPSLRIGGFQINHRRTQSVYPYGFGHHSGSISLPYIVYLYIEYIIGMFQVTLYGSFPHSPGRGLHIHHLVGYTSGSLFIQQHPHLLGSGCPQGELRSRRRVAHLLPFPFADGIVVESIMSDITRRLTTQRRRHDRSQKQVFHFHCD